MKRSTLITWCCWFFAAAVGTALAGENDDTVQQLNLVKYVPPEFPPVLQVEGVPSGIVVLAIGRDSQGVPQDLLVLESTHPAMTEAALNAVRQWRFAPQNDGVTAGPRPVLVRLSFSIHGVVLIYSSAGKELTAEEAIERNQPIKVKSAASLADKPRALHQPMPGYPAQLAGRDLEGEARVEFYIDGDGRVRLPHVTEATTSEFGDAAVAAVSQWRYEPPRDHGQPAVVADNWVFRFSRRPE
ncbi:MAG: TonB family protein [Opitutales bacterium]